MLVLGLSFVSDLVRVSRGAEDPDGGQCKKLDTGRNEAQTHLGSNFERSTSADEHLDARKYIFYQNIFMVALESDS